MTYIGVANQEVFRHQGTGEEVRLHALVRHIGLARQSQVEFSCNHSPQIHSS